MHPFEHKFKLLNHKLRFSKPRSTSSASGRCLTLFSDRRSKAPLVFTVLLLHHIELCCCRQVARNLSGACALTELKHLVICESPARLPAESSANWRLCTNHSGSVNPSLQSVTSVIAMGKMQPQWHVRGNKLHSYCKLQRQVGKAVVRRSPV